MNILQNDWARGYELFIFFKVPSKVHALQSAFQSTKGQKEIVAKGKGSRHAGWCHFCNLVTNYTDEIDTNCKADVD